jgi:beta-galactosidase
MKRKYFKITIVLSLMLVLLNIHTSIAQDTGNGRFSLDKGWRFHLGDIPFPVITGHSMSYDNAKAGKAWGAAAPEYDDTNWRLLNLPHDWAVEQPFDSTANLSQGYKQRGIGWYRRGFKIDEADHGKNLELQFDGIATHCTIWFNGMIVHRNWSGYTSSYIDITAFAKYGEDINTVVVRVDAIDQEGWWYEGAGIYRHTWLVKRAPVHLITDGVFAQPVRNNGLWTIPVETTVENSGKQTALYDVEISLIDKNGKQVAQGKVSASVMPLGKTITNLSVPVINPELWSIDKPTLYTVQTKIKQNRALLDSLTTLCGFRTIKFTADSGFYLNDKRIKIKGVCNHQDHAGVGVAVPNSLWDFRLRKLKEMGVNGYRCAHNPPSKEFLEACDRIGILVMDENRNFNSTPEYMLQLDWMIRRDRNHPSIILWSVFNEEPMQGTEDGYEMVRRMSNEVKKFDKTRPITAASSGGLFTPINVSQAVDVVGFNYQISKYDSFHEQYPNLPITSSEDVSGLMTRGEYANDLKKHLIEAYDTQKPNWGATHRKTWKTIDERPFVAGCFVWTGFDYRGEPQPFSWPTVSSSFGIMDICGFPKTAFYLHKALWVKDKPVLQLVPHWNWPADSIGRPIRVMALSNVDKVKLILNGKDIGEQVVDKYEMNTWKVPYQPGKLEAIGYKNGKQVSHFVIETTGKPESIELIPDRKAIAGEGWDAVPITVRVLDAKGRPVQNANLPIEFEVSGPGSIIGTGNGDANSHEPDKGNKRNLYNGLAQVILQSKAGGSGQLVLTAKSKGLKNGNVSITVNPATEVPFVSIINPIMTLNKWRISPLSNTKPDPNQDVADYDQNTWTVVNPSSLQQFDSGNFAIFRTTFKPFENQRINGGKIILKDVTGKAEVYIDKKLSGTKSTADKGDIIVLFPSGDGERKISVLIDSEKGSKAGLGGSITAEAVN